jgi:hypothetical protein
MSMAIRGLALAAVAASQMGYKWNSKYLTVVKHSLRIFQKTMFPRGQAW